MSLPRLISTIVAIALALCMLLLGSWYFTIGICIIVYLGQSEYFKLVLAKGIHPATKITLVAQNSFNCGHFYISIRTILWGLFA